MHVEAHQYILDQVREHWPALEDIAIFRCRWSQFLLLDKMLMSPEFDNNPLFWQTVSDLRSHWKEIVTCPYFQPTRRLGAEAGSPMLSSLIAAAQQKCGGERLKIDSQEKEFLCTNPKQNRIFLKRPLPLFVCS
jgi:hypothetical protein